MACALLAIAGCVAAIDTTRATRDDASTGAAIYREMCNRVAVAADPTLVAGHPTCVSDNPPSASDAPRLRELYAQRTRMISEINAAMDGKVGSDTRTMLGRFLPLYDDDTMQRATRTAADWLGELQNDTEALSALQRIARREGYTPPNLTPGFLRVLMRFDGLGDLLENSLGPIVSTTDGIVVLANALSVLGPELDGAFDEPDDPAHTWFLLRNFVMSRDDLLDDGTSSFIVERDTTGTARATAAAATSGTPFPIAGTTRTATDIRDRYGRLVDSKGTPLFHYVDIEGTVLSGLIREAGRIAATAPGAVGQFGRLPANWLGPPKARSQVYDSGTVRYGGFETIKSPLLELAHALAALIKKDSLTPAMHALELVATEHPQALASGTHALAVAAQRLRQAPYNQLHLEDDTAMAEEVLDFFTSVLREPGLAEQLLDALEDSRTLGLKDNLIKHMTYKDRIDFDPKDVNNPPIGEMRTEVDRTKADITDNRSLFQRYVHQVSDSDTRSCNKQGAVLTILGVSYPAWGGGYDECELNEIPSHGAFFTQSVIGRAKVVFKDSLVAAVSTDALMELNSCIDGFTNYPTPQALARCAMAPLNAFLAGVFDPAPTRDGIPVRDRHPGTMFVWELDDFYLHVTPMITAYD
ncbi:MAG: hypothetical protein H7Z43_05205, partial [Clostridia bacterium]|nr:hypothetical protein [Deltaproteobacteria bacterium]